LAKVTTTAGEHMSMLNSAAEPPAFLYQSVLAFLLFIMPWVEEHLCSLPNKAFTAVVGVYGSFGQTQAEPLRQLVEQQVIERMPLLPQQDILQLLRMLLGSHPASKAVSALAGNLVCHFSRLQPKELRQLQQLAMSSCEPVLQFLLDKKKLYSWCLALVVGKPEASQGVICEEVLTCKNNAARKSCTMEEVASKSDCTQEPLDTLGCKDSDSDSDSIPSLDLDNFAYECPVLTADSLPSYPEIPEDSDDDYCKALVLQQARDFSGNTKFESPHFRKEVLQCMVTEEAQQRIAVEGRACGELVRMIPLTMMTYQ